LSEPPVGGGRALVTGGRGFIGSHLVAGLLAGGHEVRVIGKPGSRRSEAAEASGLELLGLDGEAEVVEVDLRDAEGLLRAVAGCDSVFHLAAQTYVGDGHATAAEAIEVNVAGSRNLFDACRAMEVGEVVFASTLKAYGAAPDPPYDEEVPLGATSLRDELAYDATKALVDEMVPGLAREEGMRIAALRLTNVYGEADLNFDRLVPETAIAVADGRAPQLRTDGAPRRDFLYVDDAVAAYLAVAGTLARGEGAGEAFNGGGERPYSVREVVDLTCKVGGGEVVAEYAPELPAGEVLDRYLDSSKLRELTGWAPAVDLRTGLARTVEWYREHEEVRP
jgi:CDP-glucose 4,6-dehydratase